SRTLIQVDIDATEIGKNYPVDIALLGDAPTLLRDLVDAAADMDLRGPDRDLEGLRAETEYFCESAMRADDVPIKPQRAMAEIREALPDDALVFTDIGNSLTWVERNLLARQPNCVISFGSLAAMGSGVAAVIGGKIAAGSRPAVAVCGDGDFQIYGMEVMTAVSHDIPVVWIVLENGRLGMVRDVQTTMYHGRHVASEFVAPDLTLLAQAFGAAGYRAESPAQIAPMLREALDAGRPAILTILIDPDEMPPYKARMLAMERSMGLPGKRESMGLAAVRALIGMLRER
ncbi:MAG: thiamine pyrophosphate-binding protein, partial [Anaerolineae bacterium]